MYIRVPLKKIDTYIFELLFQHDCVVLPGLGGFVADYRDAQIDESVEKIFPPSKSFIFNKHLVNNDGLLAHKFIEVEGVSYADAIQTVGEYVNNLQQCLDTSKRYELDQVGILYKDQGGNLRFKPSNTNFLLNSYGLPIVKAIPVQQIVEVPVEVNEKQAKVKSIEVIHETEMLPSEETKVVPISSSNKNRRSYWWAAAAAIPVVFYSAWIPMKTDLLKENGNFQYSDLNPFTFNKEKVYNRQNYSSLPIDKVEKTLDLSEQFKNQNYLVYPLGESGDFTVIRLKEEDLIPKVETTYVEKTRVEDNSVKKGSGSYHLIGGCFSKKENAESFVLDMKAKGYAAFILDQNKGLHRVSISQFETRDAAKEIKSELKGEDISTWVLKK